MGSAFELNEVGTLTGNKHLIGVLIRAARRAADAAVRVLVFGRAWRMAFGTL